GNRLVPGRARRAHPAPESGLGRGLQRLDPAGGRPRLRQSRVRGARHDSELDLGLAECHARRLDALGQGETLTSPGWRVATGAAIRLKWQLQFITEARPWLTRKNPISTRN